MSEKGRNIGDFSYDCAKQFALLCIFLPGYRGLKGGEEFNDFVNGSDPMKVIEEAESFLKSDIVNGQRDILKHVLKRAKLYMNLQQSDDESF